MAQLPGHSAQPSMARDVYGSLLRIGIVFVSLRRLSGEVRHQNSNAVNSKWYASSLPGLQVFHAKCSEDLFFRTGRDLLTGDFVLQAVLAESHPHFNGFQAHLH